VHQAFEERACDECHRTHSADNAGLLQEPQLRLCLGCHRTLRKATLLTPVSAHSAVTGGRCGACHDPHFSDNETLLRRPQAELCPSCHAELLQGPDGAPWPVLHKPVAGGKCRLCHKAHSSSSPALLKAPSPQACRPCHVQFFADVEGAQSLSRHEPVAKGACGECHQVHGGPPGLLVAGARRERCVSCHKAPENAHHSIPAARIEATGGREALEKGCLLCHLPHASRRRGLLGPEGPCKACHKL
jgi:predicted CXXCH cytochrome family protein